MNDLFKTEVKSSVFGFLERYQPEVIAFEKQWDFERSSGYSGYRNKSTGEWIYDSEYRKRKRAVSYDMDFTDPVCMIEWVADYDIRKFGIKSISAVIKKVTAVVSWEVSTEGLTEDQKQKLYDIGGVENQHREVIQGEIEINTDKEIDGNKWEIVSEVKCTESGSLSPDDIDIDFKQMKMTIS